MTWITLNELNAILEEIPAKLILTINAVGKGNAETHGLLRTLVNEFKDGNSNIWTVSNNINDVTTAVKTGTKKKIFKNQRNENSKRTLLNVNVNFLICRTNSTLFTASILVLLSIKTNIWCYKTRSCNYKLYYVTTLCNYYVTIKIMFVTT